ncbi:replication factor C small subunit, partial [Candidatus Woesearchaeota archaeon CG11_big_fil_rev_8_21_14_0_20_57_5]
EKYRPQTFSELAGQQDIVEKVEALVADSAMPHLMFAGPAGTGKTSLALIIARKLFGTEWRNNFLELNASDERGIDVVRVKVKDFARTRALGDVPFKLIYLDECDALTRDAQQALRRTMENYTSTCRFILSCNYSSKIIDPIHSRCAVFRFKPLPKADIIGIIERISKQENVPVDDLAKEALYEVSGGDSRRLINLMQSAASVAKKIDEETVFSLGSMAQPKEMRQALDKALAGDFTAARKTLLDVMLNRGLTGLDVIKQLQQEILKLDIDARKKMRLVEKCAEFEFRLVEGSDEFVQLEALLAAVCASKL